MLDGISNGAFFHYSENGGKRIKYGDSICPETDYYLVTRSFDPPFSEIEKKLVNTLVFGDSKFNIYMVKIRINSNQKERYRKIEMYLKADFGIGLLDIIPTIVPLWPPIVEQDLWIPVNEKKKILCAISSCNDSPTVYQYQGSSVVELPIKVDKTGNHTLLLTVEHNEKIVSVDRKYVGRELTVGMSHINRINTQREFKMLIDDTEIDLNQITEEELTGANAIVTNNRQEVAFQDKHFNFQFLKIKETQCELPKRRGAIAFILLNEGSVSRKFVAEHRISENSNRKDERIILQRLKEHNTGNRVVPPYWLMGVLDEGLACGYHEVCKYLKQCIMQKKITLGLLRELRKTFK